jgi:putative salt-induced outer membrane protein YdiY
VRRSVILAVAMCAFAAGVRADQITLKNGDRLTGTIVKSDDKTLLIKTELAGDVNVQWAAVTAIVSSQNLHLALKDGQTVVGTVATNDGKFDVTTKTAGNIEAPKDAVVTVRSDAEQQAYDAEIDRLRNPHLLDFWSGLLDTGLSDTSGNSSTLNFTLAAKAARVTDRDKISVYATSVYAKEDNTSPSQVTAKAIEGGIRADLNVSTRLFVFGFTDFQYDAFQHLDLRNVLGGGLGYHILNTKNTQFDVFGGGDFDQEYYSSYTDPTTTLLVPSLTRKSGEINGGETLNTKVLNGRTQVTEQFSLFPNITDTGDFRFTLDISAATKLKSWLSWQVTFSDRFTNYPQPGLKDNDTILSTGLRLTFGKGKF